MASTPGILTHWPWEPLGNFKYILVAPFAVHSLYLFAVGAEDWNLTYLLIFPFMLWRMLHNQLWISFSRYRTAKGNNLIVDKSIDFEQVDRERNWDDQIMLMGILFYAVYWGVDIVAKIPFWRADGLLLTFLIHSGPVEFLYYWFHRALHHHYLYSRYHSHHHSSIVTEPITSVIHPFGEHIVYFILFAIPMVTTALITRTGSIVSVSIYISYIDLMNNMGHCNFEVIPKWAFTIFPPLKYLMYTPSFHSLHHTQFRTNYSLFMPFYDYIYGTMDKSTDTLYETSLKKPEDVPEAVHLTHLTTPESVYHLRLGFAGLASNPLTSKWYLWLMWPVTLCSMISAWIYGRTFIIERNTFKKIKAQSWAVPRYRIHYRLQWQREAINKLIEEAILEAEEKGIKVVSLGLLNQGEHFNRNGEIYLERHPKLKVKVVDGSSLAVTVVLNSIPVGTSQVLFRGRLSKVAYSVVSALCHKGIQVTTIKKAEFEKLKKALNTEDGNNLALSTKGYNQKVWLVGEDLTEIEQSKASKGTIIIPFSQFPPKKTRKDCFYLNTPSLVAPKSFGNLHSCENWLPRRVISAWRVAGIVHALEGWNVHECGDRVFDVDKIWEASLQHGFRPSSLIPA
ncbi:protein ECERIFERUM 1-like isoform X1 [Chenopodium quinoa]|uniref:protein ECERIFERUM 1-like isoform X1 n=2 Tax=Chenopodium quinoa TaxID=63459 RepID=UPI000B779364|nr:protein ECERIFERUM 1-like isoform X1 [Chenopodium quinoa]